jgi:hypothetical protein
MVKNVSAAAFPAVVENYISPETRTSDIRSEGVLCISVVNNHQGFEMDQTEDL